MKLLLVDDDASFRRLTALSLETAGHVPVEAESGEAALELLATEPPGTFDLILLDVQMPGLSGWDLLLAIRERGQETPVVFVTALGEVADRVRGLRIGADDYLVKPIEYEELVARIEAAVRARRALPTLHFGDLELDLPRRRVVRRGELVELSPREYDLLHALIAAEGATLDRTQLLNEVWCLDFETETNVVDVHVGRLRRKVNRNAPNLIETVRGEGYRAVRHAIGSAADE